MEHATIDFLFLARHAEAANGLLTVAGGACTELQRHLGVDGAVPLSHFGIAACIAVPWTATNVQHKLTIRVVDEDATHTLVSSGTHLLTVGRPPTIPPGTIQRIVFGIAADVIFPSAGGYCVLAELNSDTEPDTRTWPFHVRDIHPIVLTPTG